MRRIAAAALAATTTVSLITAPAMAESAKANEHGTSSYYHFVFNCELGEECDRVDSTLASSLENDHANGFRNGTTLDILIGTGVAAFLLLVGGAAVAASQGGMIQLPF